MELVDVLNSRKELTGEVCERNMVPENGYRLSIHIWIMNDKGEILIQQRSSNRKMFPNKWSNTGGACDAGETSLQTVLRELKEELNIEANLDDLEFIASYKRKKDYVDVWVLRQNIKVEDLIFQKEEVQAAKWVTLEKWLEILEQGEGIKSSTDYFIKYLNEDF